MALTREERLAQLKEEREQRLADAARARAEADPMRNPTVRPEAVQDDPNMVKYYGWIGGASSGRWKLYETSIDSPQAVSAAQRSQGGQTQATFESAVGANTVVNVNAGTTTQDYSGLTPEQIEAKKNAEKLASDLGLSIDPKTGMIIKPPAGYVIDPVTGKFVAPGTTDTSTGGGAYKFVGGILLFNGKAFNGTYEGKTYQNGRVVTTSSKSDGSDGGGNKGSGLSQEDIDAAIAKALAEQQAQFDALIAQQRAEADAEKLALKVKAKDKLTAMFAAYDLGSLAGFIDRRIMADVSEEQVLLELYEQPEYQARFPGMEALRKKGRTITENEYMDIEKQMTQTARFFDLPKGFYDNPADFGTLIGNEVSAKEYQDRLQIGQDLARTLNPSVKQQLVDFYGVGEGDLTAYVLDPDKALSLIQKQAKAAQFVGLGRAAGFSLPSITSQQAEAIAGTESYAKLSEAQLKQALGQAGDLRRTQQRLSDIEGMTYNEQEALDAVIEANPQALLASQQRALREVARFSARGGVTSASLTDITAI